jgi:hypothetical protein
MCGNKVAKEMMGFALRVENLILFCATEMTEFPYVDATYESIASDYINLSISINFGLFSFDFFF